MQRADSSATSLAALPVADHLQPLRPLGGAERFFWLLDQHQPFHFVTAMQVSGPTTPAQWREALDKLQKRHPLLAVSIRGNEKSQPQFYTQADEPIPLRVQTGSLSDLPHAVTLELQQRFNSSVGPLARATLLHQSDTAILLLSLHHSIADGMAAVYLIRDLMLALSGQEIGVLPTPQPPQIPALNAESDATQSPAATPPASPTGAKYLKEDAIKPTVDLLQLSPALSKSLRERARKEKTSVHGALLAAFFLAARERSDQFAGRPVRISSPINAKPYFGEDESCVLCTSGGNSELDGDSDSHFWEIVRSAREQLQLSTTRDAIFRMYMSMAKVIPQLDVPGAAQLALGIMQGVFMTNVGEAPFDPDFGALRLEAIWGPAIIHGIENNQMMGVASVKDRGICLAYTSYSPISGLLKGMEAILAEAVRL
jgi:hypothetical protein